MSESSVYGTIFTVSIHEDRRYGNVGAGYMRGALTIRQGDKETSCEFVFMTNVLDDGYEVDRVSELSLGRAESSMTVELWRWLRACLQKHFWENFDPDESKMPSCQWLTAHAFAKDPNLRGIYTSNKSLAFGWTMGKAS